MIIDRIQYERAELGVDGNAGFALLGPDIQAGEAEFVTVQQTGSETLQDAERRACKQALAKLRIRLARPLLSYYFGPSHPYGG